MKELRPTSLPELAREAPVIVLARVERLHEIGGRWLEHKRKKIWIPGAKIGEALVLRAIQGAKPGQKIAISGDSTWECDATELAAGELAIFFLTHTDQRPSQLSPAKLYPHFTQQLKRTLGILPLHYIARSGQGKLPVQQSGTEFGLLTIKLFADQNRSGNQLKYECNLLGLPRDVPFAPLTTPPTASQRELSRLYSARQIHLVHGLVPFEAIERKLHTLIASRK